MDHFLNLNPTNFHCARVGQDERQLVFVFFIVAREAWSCGSRDARLGTDEAFEAAEQSVSGLPLVS